MNPAATACAGLGLFFVGMRLVAGHLRELASGGLRRLLTRALHRPGVPQLAGLLAGILTQSTSAVAFIATGLVTAGVLPLALAIGMLAWANAGTSALVLLASFDVHLLALYLLALIGCGFFLGADQSARLRHIVYALLGLGLLLLGLGFLKSAIGGVRDEPWIREFVEFAASAPSISLLAGFVLAIAFQSSSIVTVLALPLASEGLVSLAAMTWLILGACAGSGSAVILASSGLDGPARQLAMAQGLLRGLASLALVPLALMTHGGLVDAAIHLSERLPIQVGIVFLLIQVAGIVLAGVLRRLIGFLAVRLAPPTPAEALARPLYLSESALSDTGTALQLVRLEHIRLVRALPEFLEDLRPVSERDGDAPPFEIRVRASIAVLAATDTFLTDLLRTNPDAAAIRVLAVKRRLSDFKAVQKALAKFVTELLRIPPAERPTFLNALVEGLHALLVVVGEACAEGGGARDLVEALTAERSTLVERVRRELLGGQVAGEHREAILSATLVFERLLWLLRERRALPDDAMDETAEEDASEGVAG